MAQMCKAMQQLSGQITKFHEQHYEDSEITNYRRRRVAVVSLGSLSKTVTYKN